MRGLYKHRHFVLPTYFPYHHYLFHIYLNSHRVNMPRRHSPDKDNPDKDNTNASGNTPSRSPTPPTESSRHHNKRRREDPDNSRSSPPTKRPHLPSSRLAESTRNQQEKDDALRRAREGRIQRRDEREHQASRNALLEHPGDSEEVRRLKGASSFFGHLKLHY